MTSALEILRREHRTIAAVLDAFDHAIAEVHTHKLAPDFTFYRAVIRYMREFPDLYHHPKEEEFLFNALRSKAPQLAPVLDKLREEHIDGERRLGDLEWKLDDWEGSSRDNARESAFCDAAEAYVTFQRQHADVEETIIMPEAKRRLSVEDWRAINEAFSTNDDPLFGDRLQDAFCRLRDHIAMPAPEIRGLAGCHPPSRDVKGNRDENAVD